MGRSVVKKRMVIENITAGTRKQLTTQKIFTSLVEFHTPTGNGGNIFVGDETVDSNWIPRGADTTWSMAASDNASSVSGDYIDLSRIWADTSNTGDDLIVEYLGYE